MTRTSDPTKKRKQAKRERRKRRQAVSTREVGGGGAASPRSPAAMEYLIDSALALIEGGEVEEGRRRLGLLARRFGETAQIHFAFGCAAVVEGDTPEAIRRFRRATELAPDWEEAHYNLALSLRDDAQVIEMAEACRAVIRLGGEGSTLVHQARSLLRVLRENVRREYDLDLDRYAEAQTSFKRSVERMQRGELDDAIEGFQQTLALLPRHAQSHGNLGLCYALLGRRADALQSLNKALEVDPSYEPARMNREVISRLRDGERPALHPEVMRYKGDASGMGGSLLAQVGEGRL